MTTVEERIQIFQETSAMIQQEAALNHAVQKSVAQQKIYWEQDSVFVPSPCKSSLAQIGLISARTMEASKPYVAVGNKTAILNFASSVNPGGGVLKGCDSQEEALCRISTLYPALSHPSVSQFYRQHLTLIAENKFNGKNSDDCIYTPGVVIIRKDGSENHILHPEERYSVDVITCAAPDLRYHPNVTEYDPDEKSLYHCFLRRIRRIIDIAAYNEVEVLILGAFGCGVFGTDPWLVKDAFAAALQSNDNMHRFKTVLFAIPRSLHAFDRNYIAFSRMPGIEKLDK